MERKIIKKNEMFFDELQFVAAAAFKDIKSAMPTNSIFYDAMRQRLWTTDGHRLHIAGQIGMGRKDLFFRVVSCQKGKIELEQQTMDRPGLPNISIILKKVKTIYRHEMEIIGGGSAAYSKLIRLFKKACFNFNFITDLKLFSNTWTVLIQEDEDGQHFFKSGNCLAVIMPLNVE
jgi:hypothetical protein